MDARHRWPGRKSRATFGRERCHSHRQKGRTKRTFENQAKGEARREEVLTAAQAKNPAITNFDLGNGLRVLVKQSKVRVSPEDTGMLLPV